MYAARTRRSALANLNEPWNLTASGAQLMWRWRWPALALMAVALLATGYGRVAADGREAAPASNEVVTVMPGDTLWGIAERRYPDADPRQKVVQIERLNALSDPTIEPGQRLRLPVG
jgi:nucleoid-associated protein YgaU